MSSVESSTGNTPISSTGTTKFRRNFLIRLTSVLIGGAFLDGYILGIIGPATSPIQDYLNVNDLWIGLIAAGTLFGIFIGAPLGGWLTDRYGRKPMFLADMGLFVVASSLQFFVAVGPFTATVGAVQLFIIRLLMGIAIGGEYSIGFPLMTEFAPARLRGRLLGLTLVGWWVGFMVAFIVAHVLMDAAVDWRIIIGSSTVIAVLVFLARFGLPESPRWLIQQGRHEEAFAIANEYMDLEEAASLARESEGGAGKPVENGTFAMLFNKHNWRATVFTAGFWFCAVTPFYAIATFADAVLDQYGMGSGLASGVGLSALACLGGLVTALLLDKVGRRVLTVPTQWLCTALLAVIALWSGMPAWAVLTMFLIYSFVSASFTSLTQVYPGEVFPTEVRGIGTGFAAAFSRIGAGMGTFLLPWSIAHLGMSATLLVAAVIAFIGAALSHWLAPETAGRSLAVTSNSLAVTLEMD
ncbi:MFS transporter, putative metabolite transport protein [Nocardia amikacinitolerans]|uniref:MFS transporter, putative metabolite transport protein n=1 Tax=Nocardia amikacinitolerans TaxID=756689 RepID=A0A285LU13_9NOCA|nr:MFS transporter [Nocardia amikacinitolerans]SNY88398.1 MFS transporter, putative metabolite transport protein [Nocardia amikacinitolerans]